MEFYSSPVFDEEGNLLTMEQIEILVRIPFDEAVAKMDELIAEHVIHNGRSIIHEEESNTYIVLVSK